MKNAFILICIFLLCGCAKNAEESDHAIPGAGHIRDDAQYVSLITLIASPKDYAGKAVRVIGYIHLEFEGDAIYLRKEDYERGLTKNGLWLDAPNKISEKMQKMTDRYVLIEGVFNPENHGHMGLWSGAISEINRASPE